MSQTFTFPVIFQQPVTVSQGLTGTFYGDGSNLIGASLPRQQEVNSIVQQTSGEILALPNIFPYGDFINDLVNDNFGIYFNQAEDSYTTVRSNSANWNNAYNISTAYSSVSSSFATNTNLNAVSSLLTPLTLTNNLTSQLVNNTNFNNYTTSVAATTATLLPTSVYQSISGQTPIRVFFNSVIVSGAGSTSVNGTYTLRGEHNGNPYYNLIGFPNDPFQASIGFGVGSASGWAIKFSDGDTAYIQPGGVILLPWQVAWVASDGALPVPTVTLDPASPISILIRPATSLSPGSMSGPDKLKLDSLNTASQMPSGAFAPSNLYQDLSSNWQNTYTTVQANSASWNTTLESSIIRFRDDFSNGGTATGYIGETGWTRSAFGGGSSLTPVINSGVMPNHTAIRITSATTAGNIIRINTSNSPLGGADPSTFAGWHTLCILALSSINDITFSAGFTTTNLTTSGFNASLIGFRFIAGIDTNWQFVTKNDNIEYASSTLTTLVDSGVTPVANTFYKFEFRCVTAGTIEFRINGGAWLTSTTNVPSSALGHFLIMIGTLINEGKSCDIDLVAWTQEVTR